MQSEAVLAKRRHPIWLILSQSTEGARARPCETMSDSLGPRNDAKELRQEVVRLRRENEELRLRAGLAVAERPALYAPVAPEFPLESTAAPSVTNAASVQEKVALFHSLFRGREDVNAVRWTNERTGKSGYSPTCEDPWSLRKGQPRKYLPLTDEVIFDHLSGNATIGIFPLLNDNSCWFLACYTKMHWLQVNNIHLESDPAWKLR